jgi:hypothetical protein
MDVDALKRISHKIMKKIKTESTSNCVEDMVVLSTEFPTESFKLQSQHVSSVLTTHRAIFLPFPNFCLKGFKPQSTFSAPAFQHAIRFHVLESLNTHT